METPQPSKLKRLNLRYSIPGEAEEIFRHYIRECGFYANDREFTESVVAYALWCKQKHHLTGPSFATAEGRRKMWEEIIADYPKPAGAGSFFEHRVEEFAREQFNQESSKARKESGTQETRK